MPPATMFNTLFQIHTITQGADDVVGRAVLTGTVSAFCVWGNFVENPPSMLLLEQGIEVKKTSTILIREFSQGPTPRAVHERDEIEVVGPAGHEYVGLRFKVEAVVHMPTHPRDRRRIIKLIVTRYEQGRVEQWI